MDPVLIELAKSGPWAAVAGLLLWQLLKDKASDRETMVKFMTTFQETQNAIVGEVRDIARSLRDLVTELDESRTPARRG